MRIATVNIDNDKYRAVQARIRAIQQRSLSYGWTIQGLSPRPAAMLALNLAKSVAWRVGFAIRESGQALERVGCRLQGIYSHEEQRDLKGVSIGNNTNIQDSAYVGASSEYSPPVEIGNNVSIGHGAVIKGATIGDNVLIGINAVVSEGCQHAHGM
eukprot:1151869-Pelagomonas_calceolata.AAC.3